ncbi:Serine/threonine-protein phosphatase T [Fusarium oxysporum f. sp. albedinis]|nr:Serine/threonine-protein phosphatase T [Fusarium oxysporum f. sp. albedinis]
MSSTDHKLDKGQLSKQGRRRHHNHDSIDDPNHHCHHRHHHVHRRPIDDNAMRLYEEPEWWSQLINPSALETLISEAHLRLTTSVIFAYKICISKGD